MERLRWRGNLSQEEGLFMKDDTTSSVIVKTTGKKQKYTEPTLDIQYVEEHDVIMTSNPTVLPDHDF